MVTTLKGMRFAIACILLSSFVAFHVDGLTIRLGNMQQEFCLAVAKENENVHRGVSKNLGPVSKTLELHYDVSG